MIQVKKSDSITELNWWLEDNRNDIVVKDIKVGFNTYGLSREFIVIYDTLLSEETLDDIISEYIDRVYPVYEIGGIEKDV